MSETGTSFTGSTFDPKKAEAFAGRLLGALNDAAFCLMASIGHRTGLFDAQSAANDVARDRLTGWPRRALCARMAWSDGHLGRRQRRSAKGPLSVAAGARGVPDPGSRGGQPGRFRSVLEDDIVECFKNGGGVPYERFPRFHAVMAEDSGLSVLSALESHILPLIPGLAEQLARGARGLDAGCGSGRTVNRLAELFPRSHFVGMDLSKEAIRAACDEASAKGLKNVEFASVDLADFDRTAEPESFDFITTFDAVHDQGRPLNVLKGIHRALKRDGVYLMQDIKGSSQVYNNIGHPIGTFLYAASCSHCMTVSLAQGGRDWARCGARRRRESISSVLGSDPWTSMNWPMTSRTTGML